MIALSRLCREESLKGRRTINTLFSVARTNMVPTTITLRQMLSWVPTPIATACVVVSVWAHTGLGLDTMLAVERFCKGNCPLEHLSKKKTPKCRIPNSRGHTEVWVSVSPT